MVEFMTYHYIGLVLALLLGVAIGIFIGINLDFFKNLKE